MAELQTLGHASVKIKGAGEVIYIDPYQIPGGEEATIVLVTHDHFDHCSPEDVQKVASKETKVFAPPGCKAKLEGIGGFNPVKPGGEYAAGAARIRTVPAYNVNKGFHPRAAGGVGYVVELEGKTYYHSGDTDIIPEMEGLGVDVAILPVGGTYTMTAEEAAEAFKKVGAKEGVPMHYGSVVGTEADARKFRKLIGGGK